MPQLFGKDWDRKSLLHRMGSVRQVAGAQPVVLDDGPERGVRAIDVRTGSGFQFTVVPDRGLDVWRAEYQGASLCWHSQTGPVAPAFYEPEGNVHPAPREAMRREGRLPMLEPGEKRRYELEFSVLALSRS
jgi:hypothetical protein